MKRGEVQRFMDEEGYTNSTCRFHGIQKFRKGSNLSWDYKSPEFMLKHFIRWRKNND